MTGAEIVHIPYRGSGAALIDLQAGQIQLMFENLPGAIQHAREGRLRALAVTSPQRAKATPELPTVAEAGVPGYGVVSWFAIFAPAGTPAPVVARLAAGMNAALSDPQVRDTLVSTGSSPLMLAGAPLRQFIEQEVARWRAVVERSGAKAG